MSKILERIVCDQLTSFLEENNLLPPEQNGFRRGRSIVTAMASATHAWATRRRTRTGDPDLGIAAYDFSSAFDTVDAMELDAKLERLGADKRTRDWFKSYMTGGLQRVDWNGEMSPFLLVEVGVRQGSILGPVIFLIITMDIPAVLGHAMGYADDYTAWVGGKTLPALRTDLEHSSKQLVELSTTLKLSLNPQKTQVMWVGGNTNLGDLPSITIGGTLVKPSATIEILGLEIDRRLTPSPFISTLRTSLARGLGMLRRLRVSMPPHLLASFAQGLFFSKLRVYAGIIFNVRLHDDDPNPKGSDPIRILINDVARVVTGLRRADHVRTRDLLDRAKLPSLNTIVVETSGMLAWYMTRESHPMHRIYVDSRLDTTTRASANGLVKVTDCVESIGVRNAQLIWNACSGLRSAATPAAAKSALKRFVRTLPV